MKNLDAEHSETIKETLEISSKIVLFFQHIGDLLKVLGVALGKVLETLGNFIAPLRLILAFVSSFWQLINQTMIQKGSRSARTAKVLTSFVVFALVSVAFIVPQVGIFVLFGLLSLELGIDALRFAKTAWNWFKTIFKNNNETASAHPKTNAHINLTQSVVTLGCGVVGVAGVVVCMIPGLQLVGVSLMLGAIAVDLGTRFTGWLTKTLFNKFAPKKVVQEPPENAEQPVANENRIENKSEPQLDIEPAKREVVDVNPLKEELPANELEANAVTVNPPNSNTYVTLAKALASTVAEEIEKNISVEAIDKKNEAHSHEVMEIKAVNPSQETHHYAPILQPINPATKKCNNYDEVTSYGNEIKELANYSYGPNIMVF